MGQGYKERLISRLTIFAAHDRTQLQTAAIYSSSSTTFTPPNPDIRGALIVVITGDMLIEKGAAPTDCDIGSTRLSADGDYVVSLESGDLLKIAGVSGTVTFQLTWLN